MLPTYRHQRLEVVQAHISFWVCTRNEKLRKIYNYSRFSTCMASAAVAEIGTSFIAAQESLPIIACFKTLGHKQPPAPIQVDNTAVEGFTNKSIKQKRSKAIDIRFYWIQDRCEQGQFKIYWAPGAQNLADYHTKHHPPSHHRKMRSTILNNNTGK